MDFSRFLGLYKNFINRMFSEDEESNSKERQKLLDSLKWIEEQRKNRKHNGGDYGGRRPVDNVNIQMDGNAEHIIPNNLIEIQDGIEKS